MCTARNVVLQDVEVVGDLKVYILLQERTIHMSNAINAMSHQKGGNKRDYSLVV